MTCNECKWVKIYKYKFPDNTNTVACEKYNKHLGFTNNKGQISSINIINECEFNNYKRELPAKKEDIFVGQVVLIANRWNVEVEENGITGIIYRTKDKSNAMQKLELFRNKKSWLKGISYSNIDKKWIVKASFKNKKNQYIGSYKTFLEAKRALREAAIYLLED